MMEIAYCLGGVVTSKVVNVSTAQSQIVHRLLYIFMWHHCKISCGIELDLQYTPNNCK